MVGRVVAWGAAALLVLSYVYVVIAAVGNLIGLQESAIGIGLSLTPVAWAALLFGIALPVLVLVAAVWLGRRRTAGHRVLLIAAGLCLVAAVQLELNHFVGWYPTAFFA